jgi:hypothetical protein
MRALEMGVCASGSGQVCNVVHLLNEESQTEMQRVGYS